MEHVYQCLKCGVNVEQDYVYQHENGGSLFHFVDAIGKEYEDGSFEYTPMPCGPLTDITAIGYWGGPDSDERFQDKESPHLQKECEIADECKHESGIMYNIQKAVNRATERDAISGEKFFNEFGEMERPFEQRNRHDREIKRLRERVDKLENRENKTMSVNDELSILRAQLNAKVKECEDLKSEVSRLKYNFECAENKRQELEAELNHVKNERTHGGFNTT